MRKRLGNRNGQQIVEYLIIVAAIVAAVIVASKVFGANITKLLSNSNSKVSGSAGVLAGQQTEKVPGS